MSRLSIDPAALSWSSGELLDAIAPAIPLLLTIPKEEVSTDDLGQQYLYFSAKKIRERRFEIQFFTRMESLRTWTELRRGGLCGLTPDEREVLVSLLGAASGTIDCLTDYISEVSSPVQFGRRLYYRSTIPTVEFLSTLRTVSCCSQRNSYLPRDSILMLKLENHLKVDSALDCLGEWCFPEYLPKTSNSGDRGGRAKPR